MSYLGYGQTKKGKGYKHETKQYKGYTLKKFFDGSVSIEKGSFFKSFTKGGFRRAKKYLDNK